MANYYDETRIYGFRYFQEKLLEKPFFLGVNGISGEPTEGKPWSLSSNPVFCDVYDNASFEDLVMFLLHICHYNNDNENDANAKLFSQYLTVFSKILDRISSAFDPGTPIELDNIMAMFNSLNIMSDMLFRISKSSSEEKDSKPCLLLYKKVSHMEDMIMENEHHIYFPTNPNILKLITAGLSNMYFHLKAIYFIILHNNLDAFYPIVLSYSQVFIFDDDFSLIGVEDFFFDCQFKNIKIDEEFIYIISLKNSLSFNSIKMEEILSKAKWEKKTFQRVDGSHLLSKKNLDNLEYLEEMCENPKQATVKYCKLILGRFFKSFKKKNFQSIDKDHILMSTEETQFIFHFTTQFLKSLKIMEKGNKFEELISTVFSKFGDIFNSIRFPEIYTGISIESSVILSKALMELLSDPVIKSFTPGKSGEMMAVLIRINIFLSNDKDMACIVNIGSVSVTVRDAKPIRKISNISKARKSRWMELLGNKATAEDFLQVYNEGECPICYEKMQKEDYSLLLCQHTVCESCLERLLKHPETRKHCPVCQAPVFEYLPSKRIKTICSAFEKEEP